MAINSMLPPTNGAVNCLSFPSLRPWALASLETPAAVMSSIDPKSIGRRIGVRSWDFFKQVPPIYDRVSETCSLLGRNVCGKLHFRDKIAKGRKYRPFGILMRRTYA